MQQFGRANNTRTMVFAERCFKRMPDHHYMIRQRGNEYIRSMPILSFNRFRNKFSDAKFPFLQEIIERRPIGFQRQIRMFIAQYEPYQYLTHNSAAHGPQGQRCIIIFEWLLRFCQYIIPQRCFTNKSRMQ